ncbi:glucosyltransferase domain-containing protein [Cedecea neteri]|uniref:glucosyltransferase domain-containing protein n=1 Tax=Cedecea neteri TaxID=158822 RepID=UPI002AA767DF|nr:glucosyltransferase domain-containing protein [Cedecea neteri]WPU25013.1 glucosyltransferase domain-containing protein [Cedecea neteri]
MPNKINKNHIYMLWAISFLYILPILITNSSYYDDIGRSVYGYFSWGIDGRPLSDAIFSTLDLGYPATDIAPFPQIMSVFLLSTLCYFIHLYLNPNHKFGWLIFTPIFLSPFFIQNLSFRFDSLTMSLSLISAAIPLFFMRGKKTTLLFVSVISVLTSLCIYQASLSAFVAIVCLYVIFSIKNSCNSYEIIKTSVITFIGMLIGYAIYLKIIIPVFLTSDYATTYNHMISSADDFTHNISLTLDVLGSFFTGYIAYIFLAIVTLSLLGLVKVIKNSYLSGKNKLDRAFRMLIIALIIILMFLCIPGPGLALKQMPLGPRVFIGFGFSISLLLSLISFISEKHQAKFNIIPCILIAISFSYIGTFSNAVKSQDRLTERVIDGVINDITKIGYGDVKTITIDGRLPYSPTAYKATNKLPLLKSLVPSYFDGPLAWGVVKMVDLYAGKDQPAPQRTTEIISDICSMRLITDAGLYRTYYKEGDFVLSFSSYEESNCKIGK